MTHPEAPRTLNYWSCYQHAMNWFNLLLSCVWGVGGSLSLGHIWVVVCSAPQLIWLYSISERLGWPTQPRRFNTSSPRNQSWLSFVEHSVIVLSARNWPGRLLFTMLVFPLSITAHSPLLFLTLRGSEQHLVTPQSFLLYPKCWRQTDKQKGYQLENSRVYKTGFQKWKRNKDF